MNGSKLRVGGIIWIPCEVKPGPFSDERLVRIDSEFGEWIGFVPVESLQHNVDQGETLIRGTISDIQKDRFEVILPGNPISSQSFLGRVERVRALGIVEAGHSPIHQ